MTIQVYKMHSVQTDETSNAPNYYADYVIIRKFHPLRDTIKSVSLDGCSGVPDCDMQHKPLVCNDQRF